MKEIIIINNRPYFTKNIVDILPKQIEDGKFAICFYIDIQTRDGRVTDRSKTYGSSHDAEERIKNILEIMEFSICKI